MSIPLRSIVARTTRYAARVARDYAEGNLLAECEIRRPSGQLAFDNETGRQVAVPGALVYAGYCRIPPVAGATVYGMGNEPQYFDTSTISIPLGAPTPRIDDLVTVTAHDDARLIGRVFRVTGHEAGGQMPVVQRMTIMGISPSRQWAP